MSTQILRPVASVTVTDENDEDLEVVADNARVVVDSGAVPYGSATVQVPLIAPETIEVIDPREDVRATVAIGEEGDTPRMFDLAVRSRRVDHKAKRIEMQLATDEALLQDYAPLTDDDTPRDHEASLRDLIDYVLGVVIPGAELEAGSTDADLTAAWPAVNLVPNPNFRTELGNTVSGHVNGTITRQTGLTGGPVDGVTTFSRTTFTGASGTTQGGVWIRGGNTTPYVQVTPDQWYHIGVWARCNEDHPVYLRTQVYSAAGELISGWIQVATADLVANVWQYVSGWIKIPPEGSRLGPYMYANGVAFSSGDTLDSLGWMVTDQLVPGESFDSDSVSDYYTFSLDESNKNTLSHARTPVVDRPRELFTWKAGISAWEFLQPLTAVAGLRLYCDETRAWRLIDPAEFASPGRVTLSPLNSTEGVDEISRENADIYCTGVVVKYSWTDPTGTAKTATDTAGTAGRVFIVELNRPYPGPGVAAAILARRQGQGRTQDVTALAVWAAQPGQEASISLPGTVEQIGRVASVEWELPAGLMRVGTTGLVDVPPEAWLALDPGESWLDSPIGESWTDEVI